MAEISQAIIGALQTAMAELTSAVSSVNSTLSSVLNYKADQSAVDLKAPIDKPAFTGGMKIANLPTSASGLPSGSLWVDEANGNVIKVVV